MNVRPCHLALRLGILCGRGGWRYPPLQTEELEKVTCKVCLKKFEEERDQQETYLILAGKYDPAVLEAEYCWIDPLRGMRSQAELDEELAAVRAISARTEARTKGDELLEDVGTPLPYIGMADDYVDIEVSVLREALYRGEARQDVDCDEWELEQRLREQKVNEDELWVIQWHYSNGFWD